MGLRFEFLIAYITHNLDYFSWDFLFRYNLNFVIAKYLLYKSLILKM